MTALHTGFVKFGSTEDSVIYQHALTSDPDIGSAKGTPVFSSAGMDTNNAGGWMLDLTGLDFASLSYQGQLSFDIKAQALALPPTAASIGQVGRVPRSNEFLLSWAPTSATNAGSYGSWIISSSSNQYVYMLSTKTNYAMIVNDYGKDEYVTCTLSWIGGKTEVYFDGVLYMSTIKQQWDGYASNRADGGPPAANAFNYIHLATDRGVYDGTSSRYCVNAGYPMKNFIISNRPVILPVHQLLSWVELNGDSFLQGSGYTTNSEANGLDHSCFNQMAGYLANRGIGIGRMTKTAISGSHIDTSTGGQFDLTDQRTTMTTNRYKPTVIICQAGLNDVNLGTGFDADARDTAYKLHITTMLADTTKKIFVGTIPRVQRGSTGNDTALAKTQTYAMNEKIKALPAWWDAANPSDTGRVVVYDLFTELGGENVPDDLIAGKWSTGYQSYNNDLHLSSKGRRIFGRLVGKTIYENLS